MTAKLISPASHDQCWGSYQRLPHWSLYKTTFCRWHFQIKYIFLNEKLFLLKFHCLVSLRVQVRQHSVGWWFGTDVDLYCYMAQWVTQLLNPTRKFCNVYVLHIFQTGFQWKWLYHSLLGNSISCNCLTLCWFPHCITHFGRIFSTQLDVPRKGCIQIWIA